MLMLAPKAPAPFVEVPAPRCTCISLTEEAKSGRLTQNTVWPESNARSAVLWWSQIYSFKDNGQTGKWLWDLFDISYSKLNPALGKDCHTKPGSSTYCSHESGVVLGNEPYIVAIYTKTNSASGVSDSYFYSLAKEIDRLITG